MLAVRCEEVAEKGDDGAAVEAAAKVRAKRDVGAKAQAGGIFEQAASFGDVVLLRVRSEGVFVSREVPPLEHIEAGIVECEVVAGEEPLDALEPGLIAGGVHGAHV